MRDAKVKLGNSEFTIAMPLGALDDLASRKIDVMEMAGRLSSGEFSVGEIRALIDVAGAWGADPERGRPANGSALTFADVYADEKSGGMIQAKLIAQQALMLPFVGGEEENPPEAEGG